MSGQGSGYSGSLGYPGQQRAQQNSSQYTDSTSSSYEDNQYDGRVRYAELSSLVPSATPAERQAAVGHYASQPYPPPHHHAWEIPPHRRNPYGTMSASPTSTIDPNTGLPVIVPNDPMSPTRLQMESQYYNHNPPAPLLSPPTTRTPGHQLLRSATDARQHYAAVQANLNVGHRSAHNQTGAPGNVPPTAAIPPPHPAQTQQTGYAPPRPQTYAAASGGVGYDPPAMCAYCRAVKEFSDLARHQNECPMNPYRPGQNTGNRLAAPPVVVLTKHEWRPGA